MAIEQMFRICHSNVEFAAKTNRWQVVEWWFCRSITGIYSSSKSQLSLSPFFLAQDCISIFNWRNVIYFSVKLIHDIADDFKQFILSIIHFLKYAIYYILRLIIISLKFCLDGSSNLRWIRRIWYDSPLHLEQSSRININVSSDKTKGLISFSVP